MSKILTAYFSASGITKAKAEQLAAAAGADLYEIKPEKPYSNEELNWRNPLSRCNREWIKKSCPPLADSNAKVEEYDTIFLAFPIWYFNAPLVIRSFLKAYNFSGKRIVLFATSGGSDFGKTAETLKAFANGGEIAEGKMLNGDINFDEIVKEYM
ncbi:MAG: flavodoxin [Eubacterium sp.]|nr:flavodoxin [Eubacterium sp.]